jgi:hypothetical protein
MVQYQQVSCWFCEASKRLYFNSPADLTVPDRRFGSTRNGGYKPLGTGDDLLLTNVVSFEVKLLCAPAGGSLPGSTIFTTLYDLPSNNPLFTGKGPRLLDTWSSIQDDTDATNYTNWYKSGSATSMPILFPPNSGMAVRAISITLRAWDRRTEQTRQTTIIQDL